MNPNNNNDNNNIPIPKYDPNYIPEYVPEYRIEYTTEYSIYCKSCTDPRLSCIQTDRRHSYFCRRCGWPYMSKKIELSHYIYNR